MLLSTLRSHPRHFSRGVHLQTTTLRQGQAGQATAHTLFNPSADSLTAHLGLHPPSPSTPLLYLLSTSTPPHRLSALIPTLQAIPNSIGSFSTSPAGSEPEPTLSLLSLPGAKAFRTDLVGRPGAEVGRWQRPRPLELPWEEDRKGDREGDLVEKGWDEVWRAERGVGRLSELEGLSAETFLVLSDATPNPLLRTIESMYPSSRRMGLITAPTPFITSRPHTLFHGSSTYSSGAVGVYLPRKWSEEVQFPLQPLTEPIEITSARGNMLLRIQGKNDNPTQRLITALQARGTSLSKEEDFYLSLLDERGETIKVVKILSGDPSRGALALETEDPLLPGQMIQFMYRDLSVGAPDRQAGQVTFSALSKYDHPDREPPEGEARTVEGFVGYTEDGFITNSGVCNVPFATSTSRLP